MDRTDLQDRLARWWRPLLILGVTVALFAWKDLFSVLTAAEYAGRDLVANEAYAHLMRSNLLRGTVVDWSNRALLGFPAFAL
ncbi:MAG: hypothetical protein ABEK12_01950 [Candidatus Nanohaloarchaea archaeon]